MTRWGMAIDLDRCIGCWACAVACKLEHSVGEGLWWQHVDTVGGAERDTSTGTFPFVQKHYRPRNCFHCADPPCLPVCPTGAITKRADGIVEIAYDACNGCGDCIPACPYDAIELNVEAPILPAGLEDGHGAADVPPRSKGVVEKCTFCVHRVDKGEAPACVLACPTDAITFGDLEDPSSDVAQKCGAPGAAQPSSELGADPSVSYLPAKTGANQRRSGESE